ncbi:MAG: putative acetyltransferase [Gemmatimonadetes bacterium]|jgi:putative acetyltransferase|nr:putative acetyltransferase [Gemmatimonadota bacterium]
MPRPGAELPARWSIRAAEGARDLADVRRLVTAHGDARADTPGVEYVYADAAGMPGPYVPPRGGLWLAVADDTGVGCVALRPVDESSAEVKRMFVDPAWRGCGIGRALMERVIEEARVRGYAMLRLGTLHDMDAALALYRSLGFQPIARYRADELIDTRFFELPLSGRSDEGGGGI